LARGNFLTTEFDILSITSAAEGGAGWGGGGGYPNSEQAERLFVSQCLLEHAQTFFPVDKS